MNRITTILTLLFVPFLSTSQTIEFADTSFQRAILSHDPVIDLNGDGLIQKSEAERVKDLELYQQNINSIEDVIHFPFVERISATENNLTVIQIDSLLFLESLLCSSNKIKEVAVSNTPNLKLFYAGGNEIRTFSVIGCPNLSSLDISKNKIDRIDLSLFPNLSFLSINSNDISELDVSNNLLLKQIYCSNVKIKTLDLSKNSEIVFSRSRFDESINLVLTPEQRKKFKNAPPLPPPPARPKSN